MNLMRDNEFAKSSIFREKKTFFNDDANLMT